MLSDSDLAPLQQCNIIKLPVQHRNITEPTGLLEGGTPVLALYLTIIGRIPQGCRQPAAYHGNIF